MLKLLDMDDIIFDSRYDDCENNKLVSSEILNKYKGKVLFVVWEGCYSNKYHEAIIKINDDGSSYDVLNLDKYGNTHAVECNFFYYNKTKRAFPSELDVCRFTDPATGQTITPIKVEATSTQYILTTCNDMRIAISKSTAVINPLVYDEQDDEEEIPTHIISATDDNTTSTDQPDHTNYTINLGEQTAFHNDHQTTGKEQAMRILAASSEIMNTCKQYDKDDELGTEPISIATANLLQEITNLTSIYGITQDQLNDAITETKNTNTEQGMFTGKEPPDQEQDNK